MPEKGEEAEFHDALGHLETAMRQAIRSFAKWTAENWKMNRDEWAKSFADPPPPDGDYFEAYNAGVESVTTACEFFLDEYAPR